ELDYFFADAEPALILCEHAKAAALAALPSARATRVMPLVGAGSLSELAQSSGEAFSDVSRAADDLACMIYTSGTTGRSKGAMLTHDNLLSNAEVLVRAWSFTRSDVLLHILPIYHVHGLFVALHTVLFSGASMLFRARFDAAEAVHL